MDLGLKGRVAIVTGSSQGIGKAIAQCLSQEGARLTICARKKNVLDKAAQEIQARTGNEVVPIQADLNEQEDIEALVERTAAHFGRIDILVNNTGGPPSTIFMETSNRQWLEASNSLLMSVVDACRAVIPHMQKARWGRIVNMTSYAAKQPIDQLIMSNTIRAGILGLTKCLSNELASYGVLVNAVCPGWTMTDRVAELAKTRAKAEGRTPDEIIKSWESQIPLKRMAKPEEIASLVAFLASERASYITGAAIQVDGGVIKGLF